MVLQVKTSGSETMETVERRKKVVMSLAAKAAAKEISVLAVWT